MIDDQVAFVLAETVAGSKKEVMITKLVHLKALCHCSFISTQADVVGPTEEERRKMTLEEVKCTCIIGVHVAACGCVTVLAALLLYNANVVNYIMNF